MKHTKRTLIVLVLLAACAWVGLIRAQRFSPAATDKLTAAVALLEMGKPLEARPLLAGIATNDPAYGVAQAYDALCRYEVCRAAGTNSYGWFLEALKSPAVQAAVLDPELREELAFKGIDALYQSHFYGKAADQIAAFNREHPASARLETVAEYQAAVQFEWGLGQIYGAVHTEGELVQSRWTNALAGLEQFVALAGKLPSGDYVKLGNRSLEEDLAVALAVLAESPDALAKISVQDPGRRERYGLLRVGLQHELHPEAHARNLQVLADCLAEWQTFPASPGRPRVEYALAQFSFRRGGELCEEAAAAPPGGERSAGEKRASGSGYFQIARALQRRLQADAPSGFRPVNLSTLRADLFASYYHEQDYVRLRALTAAQLTNAASGNLDKLAATLFDGMALSRQTPAKLDAAATRFDAVLAQGFKNLAARNEMVFAAARWRVHLALLAGDRARALEVIQWVERSTAEAEPKEQFLRDHASVLAWAGTK